MATKDTLESKRNEANKIVAEIEAKSIFFEDNLKKIKIILSEMDNNSSEAKKLNTSLNRIISTTNEAVTKFRSERDKVSHLLTQVNNFYEKKYLPLLNKIEDNDNGFEAKLKLGTQFNLINS